LKFNLLTLIPLHLQSLAQLLDEISNIVINDEVGDKIWEAILKSHEAINYIQEYDLTNGYNLSKQAFLAAETAFSDPSLLALLYFPEDQKSVYILYSYFLYLSVRQHNAEVNYK